MDVPDVMNSHFTAPYIPNCFRSGLYPAGLVSTIMSINPRFFDNFVLSGKHMPTFIAMDGHSTFSGGLKGPGILIANIATMNEEVPFGSIFEKKE